LTGEDVMAKKKRKRSVSLKPVVDAIDETIEELREAKKKASDEDKEDLDCKIKLIRGLRTFACAQCKGLNL
jgi:hypothetical protein